MNIFLNFNLSFAKFNLILSDGFLCNLELISKLDYETLAKFKFRFICSDLFISGLNLTFKGNDLGIMFF